MEKLPDLSSLSGEAKDALIIALWEEVQQLRQRLDELEKPKKTSENSSIPPSKGFKANKKPTKPKKGGERRAASVGRASGGRKLHPRPDETVIARLECCPECAAAIPAEVQRLHSRYDRIGLPKIQPIVTRVERYQGQCKACGAASTALVPEHLGSGSPFGLSLESLSISEGALANLLTRVQRAVSRNPLALTTG